MNIGGYKVFIALVLFFVAFAGGVGPIMLSSLSINGKTISCCNAFAGGVLLAAAIVHLLPDASDELQDLGHSVQSALRRGSSDVFPIANVIAIVAFLLLMMLDSWLSTVLGKPQSHGAAESVDAVPQESLNLGSHETRTEQHLAEADTRNYGGQPFLIALVIHSVIEGMSIGASTRVASLVGIFIAVGAHKAMAGFALGSELLRTWTKHTTFYCVFIFAVCSPVGIMIGNYANAVLTGTGVGVLLAIASGTFLFVSIPELVISALERSDCRGSVRSALLLGVLGMSLLAAWA